MLEQLHYVLILIAILGSGLIAGVFFAFSTFVMRALSRLTVEEGIRAMQAINITVLNPWFLGVFFGTAVVCIVLLIWSFINWQQADSVYLIAASVFYLVGCFMVTGMYNVPKNEVLAKVDAKSTDSESIWNNYVETWTTWNHVRTIASTIAVIIFALTLS